MDRYIGLDAHSSSCTLAVIGPSGRKLRSQVLETNARVLIDYIRTIPRNRHFCLEEGILSNWLYEVLTPHVQEMVVVSIRQSRGPKDDKRDAFALAEMLRVGAARSRVYKERGDFGALGELCKGHNVLVIDSTRAQNRIKSLFLSRGIPCSGSRIYSAGKHEEWIEKLPIKSQPLAETLYLEYDALEELHKRAKKAMLKEARKHLIYRILRTVPGIGEIRAAQLMAVVVTPYRFSNKRSFWAYSGLAIIMRSSSDWVRTQDGDWLRTNIGKTRGLNKNFNRSLKSIFKGAATTVTGQSRNGQLYQHYQQLLEGGTKPNLAKLTIARQIASIVLSIWRTKEVYDPKKLRRAK